jgi:hypothetical protein
MLSDAVSFPRAGEDSVKRLLIGGALVLLSGLIVPAVPLYGYVLRTIAAAARGADEPPPFEDWTGLLVDGAKTFAVVLAYQLPALVFGIAGLAAGTMLGDGTGGTVALLCGVLAGAAAVLAAYLVPGAVASLAINGSLRDAFTVRRLLRIASTTEYLTGVLLAAAVLFVGQLVGVPTSALLVGVVLLFYALVAAAYVVGTAFRGAAAAAVAG